MLWLCIYLPQWPLESLLPAEHRPTVVFVTEGNRRRIVNCNALAARMGVDTTELTVAQAIAPQLLALERNAQMELAALKRLAGWGYQWSSFVAWSEANFKSARYAAQLWLEIGASRSLFGSYRALIAQLEHSLQALRYTYRLGVAPTLEGAALLARAGQRLLVTSLTQLSATMRKLPIVHLDLSHEVLQALQRSGIVHIETLLNLPSASLARRFGPSVTSYLARLQGHAPDPRPAYRLPKEYRERYEFGFDVRTVEALLFPLQRMLQEFCGYLRAADIATQRFTLILEHEQRALTRIDIGLSTPSRDVARLFGLVKEKLHSTALTSEVYGVRIEAHAFTAPAVRQKGLFANDAEVGDELEQVLEKIAIRLGADNVRSLKSVADHRPEYAAQLASHSPAREITPLAARPLWLLPQPRRLATPPLLRMKPERIAGGWWAEAAHRDYYTARSKTGARCWIFFDRNDGEWYLHGYWA